jgi:hypothetical protein
MSDRELLELAGKAVGVEIATKFYEVGGEHAWRKHVISKGNEEWVDWNPLKDNSDAFHLAVRLRIPIQHGGPCVSAYAGQSVMAEQFTERHEKDPYAATRRAIVRAAAAIGKAMK